MGELQALLRQKETLSEQLRRIAETCEGLENESNAAKVATLNEEQFKLTALKNELQEKVAGLEKQLLDVSRKINELSGSGVDRILNAIKNQRWFFFKNKSKVMFDKSSGILWPNLNYFNIGAGERWGKCTGRLSSSFNSDFVKTMKIDDISEWELPLMSDIVKLLNDETFPFYQSYSSSNRNIRTNYNSNSYYIYSLLVSDGGSYKCVAIDKNPSVFNRGNWDCGILPKSHMLIKGFDYENNISSVNKVFSEKEKLLMTLNVFVTNGLEPIFDDAAITELFRQIYIVKPEVQRQLTEIQQQIERLNEVELISPKLDWLALKTKFDLGASPVRYAESLKNLTEHLLNKFDDYTAEKNAALDELIKLSPPNELVPDIKAVRADLESFHEDALTLTESLLKTKSLMRLTENLAETQPSFEVVTEILTEKIRGVLLKVEFFESQPEFVRKACVALNKKFDFRSEYLKQFHIADRVAQKVLLKLIRYVKAGHLQKKISGNLTAAEIALNHLENYRESVAEIYKNSPASLPPKEETNLQVEMLQKNFSEVISMLNDEKERHHLKNLLRPLENL